MDEELLDWLRGEYQNTVRVSQNAEVEWQRAAPVHYPEIPEGVEWEPYDFPDAPIRTLLDGSSKKTVESSEGSDHKETDQELERGSG